MIGQCLSNKNENTTVLKFKIFLDLNISPLVAHLSPYYSSSSSTYILRLKGILVSVDNTSELKIYLLYYMLLTYTKGLFSPS